MNRIKEWARLLLYGNSATTVIRIAMGTMFLYSGFFKIINLASFSTDIIRYGIVPEILIPYFAITIAFLELLLGILFIIGFRIKASALIAFSLTAVFIIAISYNVLLGNNFECGCFELARFGIHERIGIELLVRDAVIIILFALLFAAQKHPLSMDSLLEKRKLKRIN